MTEGAGRRNQGYQAISDWLIEGALGDIGLDGLFEGFCERLATVIPLSRAQLGMRTLHPLLEGVTLRWTSGAGSVRTSRPHGSGAQAGWQEGPLRVLVEEGLWEKRYRLESTEDFDKYPLLVELRDAGMTDYIALMTSFAASSTARECDDGMITSWATDRPGGFRDDDIATLKRLLLRFGVGAKIAHREQTADNVVSAYLGTYAGRRVLDGKIKLGDGDSISAVIWYSDLRHSTDMADHLPSDAFLSTLNTYFKCTAGAVLDHGGEVLRFIGDAVLAIFSIDSPGESERAARVALAAARDAESRMAQVNASRSERGELPLGFGLGLHVGDVMFGNIGVPERIEFSVIGPAADEVSRLEELTKAVKCTVVVSSAFTGLLPLDWQSLGRHKLRGVSKEQEVFAPPPQAAADSSPP